MDQSVEIGYRIYWARTYLKGMGLATNSERGVWTLTEAGRAVNPGPDRTLRAEYIKATRKARKRSKPGSDDDGCDLAAESEYAWRAQLLDTLLAMPPDAFEPLCKRLLREAGLSRAESQVVARGGAVGPSCGRPSSQTLPARFKRRKPRPKGRDSRR